MTKRQKIMFGMAPGALWAVALLWIGGQIPIPISMIQPTLMGAVFGPGLVLIALIGRLAQRRFVEDESVDGQAFTGAAEIDQRVLNNTVEQAVLALCIWPLVGFFTGAGTVLALGGGFVVARLAFWVGYHVSPPLRAFGFAATFFPTVFAAVFTVWNLLAG